MKKTLAILLCVSLFITACKYRGEQNLPQLKEAFKDQIAKFERQKERTDAKVETGVEKLTAFEQALKNATDVDKEFKRIYTHWHRVNKNTEKLNKEYLALKQNAQELFAALKTQTNSLKDQQTKNELNKALNKTQNDYFKVLNRTSLAIDKLNVLHGDALEIVKALEVAVALGQISDIQAGLSNIESRVAGIMEELNQTIVESRDLYEKRMKGL
ncbi:MAG: hypothetical protein COB98_11980 [Flavobacteriaceae bacterium]|nr:MAG: hypothetical protein COB98_11980 [Flavobacteriaceae bacterium]